MQLSCRRAVRRHSSLRIRGCDTNKECFTDSLIRSAKKCLPPECDQRDIISGPRGEHGRREDVHCPIRYGNGAMSVYGHIKWPILPGVNNGALVKR